ncbi:MAG TPA: hypothetical protein VMM79_14300 [Longimicrobiales bacterium]|nr:hypothetical protein [Longimicrobiales bacterium]
MARQVDKALEEMDALAFRWLKLARKVLRYGNIDDVEELEERQTQIAEYALMVSEGRAADAVQKRHRREIDRIVAEGIARGVDPDRFRTLDPGG